MKRFVAALMLSGLLVAGGANSAVTVSIQQSGSNIQQSGSNVVVTTSGSLNTAAMGTSGLGSTVAGIWPYYGFVQTGSTTGTTGDHYISLPNAVTSPNYGNNYWGNGSNTAGTSASGALFAFDFGARYILVPTGYTTGASLAGTLTITGTTLAGLGITNTGTYTLSFGSGANTDSVTVYVGVAPPSPPAAVPTLSEWAQLMLGLMVITMIGWQWRKQQS